MNDMKTIENTYTTGILEAVRQRLGLECDDISIYQDILDMTKGEVFNHVLSWNGLY